MRGTTSDSFAYADARLDGRKNPMAIAHPEVLRARHDPGSSKILLCALPRNYQYSCGFSVDVDVAVAVAEAEHASGKRPDLTRICCCLLKSAMQHGRGDGDLHGYGNGYGYGYGYGCCPHFGPAFLHLRLAA